MGFTYAIVDQTTRELVEDDLIRVERKSSQTDAYFIPEGHYKVLTSNGESLCQAPVWILWDTSGSPYPITPDEFEKLYSRIDGEMTDGLHPATVQLLELFEYKHLSEHLQEISKQFHDLAWNMAQRPTQRGAEQTTCLRKLLEAKDCAVRMGVPLGQIGSNSPPLNA